MNQAQYLRPNGLPAGDLVLYLFRRLCDQNLEVDEAFWWIRIGEPEHHRLHRRRELDAEWNFRPALPKLG